jgi:hypothetical protein
LSTEKKLTQKFFFFALHSWYAEFTGGGFTPDYGSPPLMTALVQFVEALGSKYDGDNRIAFIHLGLLGFWYVLFV